MSTRFGDDLAANVRKAAAGAATAAFGAFGTATAAALAEMTKSAFVGGHAATGGDALAQALGTAFGTDLRGRVVTDVDANGLNIGDAHVESHLAAFACGEAASPIDEVSAEHAFAFALGAVAALDVSATLTLKARCARDATSGGPKTSTSAHIKLALAWSSER
jgi:hypothetical protein